MASLWSWSSNFQRSVDYWETQEVTWIHYSPHCTRTPLLRHLKDISDIFKTTPDLFTKTKSSPSHSPQLVTTSSFQLLRLKVLESFVLVCLGCYNRIPQTRYLINNMNVLLMVWTLEVQDPGTSTDGWGPSIWFTASTFSLHPHLVEGAGDLPGLSFIRALIPFMRAPLSGPNHLPNTPPSKTITLGVIILTNGFWGGHKHSEQSIILDSFFCHTP